MKIQILYILITCMKYFSVLIFQMFKTKYKEKIFALAQFAASNGLALQQQTHTSPAINVNFR